MFVMDNLLLIFSLSNFYCYFWHLNSNHDGRAHTAFAIVYTFWFIEWPQHFEKPTDLFIFGDSLFIDSMEPVMNGENLI